MASLLLSDRRIRAYLSFAVLHTSVWRCRTALL